MYVFNLDVIEENEENVDVINVDNGNLEPENVNDCKIPEKIISCIFDTCT